MTEISKDSVKGQETATVNKNSKKPAEHPPYLTMISEAIEALHERKGSSKAAILKYVNQHYKLDGVSPNQINSHLKLGLQRGVEGGQLSQMTGVGASGRFLLSKKNPTKKQPKNSSAPEKPTTTQKTPVAKKVGNSSVIKKAATPVGKVGKSNTPKKAGAAEKKTNAIKDSKIAKTKMPNKRVSATKETTAVKKSVASTPKAKAPAKPITKVKKPVTVAKSPSRAKKIKIQPKTLAPKKSTAV